MGEIHELFVLALSLVWFAGRLLIGHSGARGPSGPVATPSTMDC